MIPKKSESISAQIFLFCVSLSIVGSNIALFLIFIGALMSILWGRASSLVLLPVFALVVLVNYVLFRLMKWARRDARRNTEGTGSDGRHGESRLIQVDEVLPPPGIGGGPLDRCEICGGLIGIEIVLLSGRPNGSGAYDTMCCVDCARKAGAWCDVHERPKICFSGRWKCLMCELGPRTPPTSSS